MSFHCLKVPKIFKYTVATSKSLSAWRKVLVTALLVGSIGFFYLPEAINLDVDEAERKINATVDDKFRMKIKHFHGTAKYVECSQYCTISECITIVCSDIPSTYDVGEVTVKFIESDCKNPCEDLNLIKLIYNRCRFSADALNKDWLKTNVSIKELTFNDCSLNKITDDAFSGKIYQEIRSISLSENKISSLRRVVFNNLQKLKQLAITDNVIEEADLNLLENVANTLQVLTLDGAIKNDKVLRNITGRNLFPMLQSLSIQRNLISKIDSELFAGMTSLKSLYINTSGVTSIAAKSFNSMAASLQQIFLQYNNITTLPNDLFSFVLPTSQQLRLSITDNPWHCDCKLQWMQDFIRDYPKVIRVIPICMKPKRNAKLSFINANFCNGSVPDISSTTKELEKIETTSSSTTDLIPTKEDTTVVTCSDDVDYFLRRIRRSSSFRPLQTIDYKFQSRFHNYFINELQNGSLLVNLPRLKISGTLLWINNHQFGLHSNSNKVEKAIQCMRSTKRSLLLRDTQPNTSYTICLLIDEDEIFSPLNCLGLTTQFRYGARAWLTNGDKPVILSILIISAVILCLISAFSMFVFVREHPTLLRGSKRVMLVKRRKVEAIVLPEGVKINDDRNYCEMENVVALSAIQKEDGYVTPLSSNKFHARKDSRVSRTSSQSSATSYVSGVEPTLVELASWRLNRLKNSKLREVDAPPVPPHPPQFIPSISIALDSSKAEAFDEDSTSTA